MDPGTVQALRPGVRQQHPQAQSKSGRPARVTGTGTQPGSGNPQKRLLGDNFPRPPGGSPQTRDGAGTQPRLPGERDVGPEGLGSPDLMSGVQGLGVGGGLSRLEAASGSPTQASMLYKLGPLPQMHCRKLLP